MNKFEAKKNNGEVSLFQPGMFEQVSGALSLCRIQMEHFEEEINEFFVLVFRSTNAAADGGSDVFLYLSFTNIFQKICFELLWISKLLIEFLREFSKNLSHFFDFNSAFKFIIFGGNKASTGE